LVGPFSRATVTAAAACERAGLRDNYVAWQGPTAILRLKWREPHREMGSEVEDHCVAIVTGADLRTPPHT